MLFCPSCGNLLLVEQHRRHQTASLVFDCQSCPYIYPISKTFTNKIELDRKKVDGILGGVDAWKNVDSIEMTCPKCEHNRAYFMQIQIRSADEPSSVFYKCCSTSCSYQWREG